MGLSLLHLPSPDVRHEASGEGRKILDRLGSSLFADGTGGRGGCPVDLESGFPVASRWASANSAQPC